MRPDPAAVRELFARVRGDSELAAVREAHGWVVVSRDDESGHLHISGPYAEPEQALIAAQADHDDVNQGLAEGEAGWTHTVWPLFPPS